jgi:hypothetical protein
LTSHWNNACPFRAPDFTADKKIDKIGYLAPYKKEADKTGTWDKGVTAENAPGCTIDGAVTVSKVAGNLHVALGMGAQSMGQMIYQFSMSDLTSFNASHFIHELSFGPKMPGIKNPLDSIHNEVSSGTGQYMYYIKVVPSEYIALTGERTSSNQYSVTEHFIGVDFMAGQFPHPGVFFKYDFSPIMVEYKESRPSFFHFATNLCAILGGVFTVFSMVDTFFHQAALAMKKHD